MVQRTARRAFTLLELLVVVAIIGVLAALAVGAAMMVLGGQEESNSRTAMQTVYSILQKHWDKVVADAKKETPSDAAFTLAGGSDQAARAQVMWIKLRLMEAFPISYDEINNDPVGAYISPRPRNNIANYQRKLAGVADVPARWKEQNSACLLMALSVNRGGVVLDEEKLGPFLKDTQDSPPIKMIVDGWNHPIAFFRFPTSYPNLLSGSAQWLNPAKSGRGATYSDPLDPDGTLQNSTAYTQANFTGLVHGGVSAGVYIIPAVVSRGKDGELGLKLDAKSWLSDMSVTNQGQANDNIYSFFLKVGSTGN